MVNLLTLASQKLSQFFQKAFVRDSLWMLFSKAFRAVIQMVYFILVARSLGAENYGVFEGVKAIWAIVFPFVGLGLGEVMVQNVSRNHDQFSKEWGKAIQAIFISVLISLVTLFPLTVMLFPEVNPAFIVLLLLADLIGLKLCMLAGNAFIAVDRVKQASQYGLIYSVSKFALALLLPLFPEEQRLLAWGVLYCLGSLIPAAISLLLVSQIIGRPAFNPQTLRQAELGQGFFFSLSESAATINTQVDRTMLFSLAGPIAAGVYGAGYRFIDMGFIPIFAVLGASYARFFKHGEAGIEGTIRFARKLIPIACLYGIVCGVILILFAPLVTTLLGEDFIESAQVLIWLSPILLIAGLQYLAADSLTGAGFQRSRSFIQVAAAALNVGLNFYWIPRYSWQGAIWATLISELFKLVALWLIVGFLYRRNLNMG
jgi:O-antigen/teichoic acid export membrane protein